MKYKLYNSILFNKKIYYILFTIDNNNITTKITSQLLL